MIARYNDFRLRGAVARQNAHRRHRADDPAAGRLRRRAAAQPRLDGFLVLGQARLVAAQQGARVQPLPGFLHGYRRLVGANRGPRSLLPVASPAMTARGGGTPGYVVIRLLGMRGGAGNEHGNNAESKRPAAR